MLPKISNEKCLPFFYIISHIELQVLFQVAKYWFELFLRQAPPGGPEPNPFLEFDPTPPPEEMPPQVCS